jgi:hypothetical protein
LEEERPHANFTLLTIFGSIHFATCFFGLLS